MSPSENNVPPAPRHASIDIPRGLSTPKLEDQLSYSMSEEEEYRHVYDFIGNHSYPTGFSKNEKRILRRKCQEHFCVRNGLLYYAARGKETKDDQKWREVARSVEDRERIMQSCHSSDEGKSTPKFNNLILNVIIIASD